MNAILIDEFYPDACRDSGSIDVLNTLQALQALGHHVTLMTTVAGARPKTEDISRASKFDSVPPNLIEDWLIQHGRNVDVAFVCRPGPMSTWIHRIRAMAPQAMIIYLTVDLHFLRLEREYATTGNRDCLLNAERYRSVELQCIRQADVSVVVSSFERDYLRTIDPTLKVEFVPLFRDRVGSRRSFADRPKRAVFIGGYQHQPNIDAARYLAEVIGPHVRQADPEIELVLAGSNMPEQVRSLEPFGVKVVGHVADLSEFFESSRISVAPLRFGAGQKGKVLSSLAHRVPVVCTSVSAEGMFDQKPQGVTIADDPLELAAAIVVLCNNERIWTQLSDEADRFAQSRDTSELPALLDSLIHRYRPCTRPKVSARPCSTDDPVLSIFLVTRDGSSADLGVLKSWITQVEQSRATELLILNAGRPVPFELSNSRVTEVLGLTDGNDRTAEGLRRARGSHIRYASDDDPVLSNAVHDLESQVLSWDGTSPVSSVGDFILHSRYGVSVCEQEYQLYPQGLETYRRFISSQGAIPAFYSVYPRQLVAHWSAYLAEYPVPFSYMDWLLTMLAFAYTRVSHPGRGVMMSHYDLTNWCDRVTSERRNLKIMASRGVPPTMLPLINLFWILDALRLLQRPGLQPLQSESAFKSLIAKDQLKRFLDNLEFRIKLISRQADRAYIAAVSKLSPIVDATNVDINKLRSGLAEVIGDVEGSVPHSLSHYFSELEITGAC